RGRRRRRRTRNRDGRDGSDGGHGRGARRRGRTTPARRPPGRQSPPRWSGERGGSATLAVPPLTQDKRGRWGWASGSGVPAPARPHFASAAAPGTAFLFRTARILRSTTRLIDKTARGWPPNEPGRRRRPAYVDLVDRRPLAGDNGSIVSIPTPGDRP